MCSWCSHVASVVVLVLLILLKEHEVLKKNKSRGSYRSAHVLLNLLNELGKRDKM